MIVDGSARTPSSVRDWPLLSTRNDAPFTPHFCSAAAA